MLITMVTADEERLDRFPWNVQYLLNQGLGVVAMRAAAFSKACECHCKKSILISSSPERLNILFRYTQVRRNGYVLQITT